MSTNYNLNLKLSSEFRKISGELRVRMLSAGKNLKSSFLSVFFIFMMSFNSFVLAQTGSDLVPEWGREVFYQNGENVLYHGRVWRAIVANVGIAPDDFGQQEWQQERIIADDVEPYDSRTLYSEGILVYFDDAIWESTVDNMGEKPGETSAWIYRQFAPPKILAPDEDALSCDPETDMDCFVTDNSQYSADTDSMEDIFILREWHETTAYSGLNNLTLFRGALWELSNDNNVLMGESPVGGCSWGMRGKDTRSVVDEWSRNNAYLTGDRVIFNGFEWIALSNRPSAEPGIDNSWIVSGLDNRRVTPWSAQKNYSAGMVVSHEGSYWVNATDRNESEPSEISTEEHGTWLLFSKPQGGMPFPELRFTGKTYAPIAGMLYSFDGHFWVTQAKGNEIYRPYNRAQGWLELDVDAAPTCSIFAFQKSGIPLWNADSVYARVGIVVRYSDSYYTNIAPVFSVKPPDQDTVNWSILEASKATISQNDSTARAWTADTVYQSNDIVIHNGIEWKNLYATQDTEPGKHNVWQPVSIAHGAAWNSHVIYGPPGIVVSYNNTLWENRYWTQGDEPGVVEAWKLYGEQIENGAPWSSTTVYGSDQEYSVMHDGILWKNIHETQGQEPGKNDVWQPVKISDGGNWNKHIVYAAAGHIVQHEGFSWKNSYWTRGDEPGNSSVWVLWNNGGANNSGGAWNKNVVYETSGTVVTHNNKTWINAYWTQGDEPGMAVVWQPEIIVNGDPWAQYTTYPKAGYIVSYNSEQWKNSYYTQGDEPGKATVWVLQSSGTNSGGSGSGSGSGSSGGTTLTWQKNTVYETPNTLVIHNGTNWVNSYWTQGNEPGKHLVWQPQTITNGDPWGQYVVYNIGGYVVSHNGAQWENSYWTQGDEPGSATVWVKKD